MSLMTREDAHSTWTDALRESWKASMRRKPKERDALRAHAVAIEQHRRDAAEIAEARRTARIEALRGVRSMIESELLTRLSGPIHQHIGMRLTAMLDALAAKASRGDAPTKETT